MSKKESAFISAVVYSCSNSDNLLSFILELFNEMEKHFANYEIVIVDNCNPNMESVKSELTARISASDSITIVHMSEVQSLEACMRAGVDVAVGDFVYEFDDIFVDYEPEVIMEVYHKLIEGNDIVAASSKGKLRLTSRVFYSLYNRTSRGKGKIGPETFRIVSRRAINRIKSMGQYIPYRKAVYMNCGLNTSTICYNSKDVNVRIKNKTVASERTTLALDSFIYFTNALERISAIMCGIFLFLTMGMGIYIAFDIFNGTNTVEGWLSTMSFLAFGFFGVFALLTIILKYLSVLLNLIFRQQRYLVSDIEKVVKN